jgi:hypothetical protein
MDTPNQAAAEGDITEVTCGECRAIWRAEQKQPQTTRVT